MRHLLEKGGVVALFVAYLVMGIAIHGDYGISWDEPLTRLNGLVNLRHVSEIFFGPVTREALQQVPTLAEWPDRDYGVAFEWPLAAAEMALRLEEHEAFRFRHLATFLFFALGVAAIYQTARSVRGSRLMGLAAALVLVLSPRIFGESFFNSKDIGFMAACAMAIFTMERFLRSRSLASAALHGFVCAFAIDIRVMGVVMPSVTLGASMVLLMQGRWRSAHWLSAMGTFVVTLAVSVYAMFPYLWPHPIDNFLSVFANMSRFRWSGEVLYLGEFVLAEHLPWHYIPVWIGVTAPVPFTALMLLGAGLTLLGLLRSRWRLWTDHSHMMDLICLALLVGPVIAVIVLKSVLYDGWRQLYFVYPAFVLLTVKGVDACLNAASRHRLAHGALIAGLAAVVVYQVQWIVRAHPLQNVYFNALAGSPWKDRFDLDYWGLGNREALEHILQHDPSPFITVNAGSRTELVTTFQILSPQQRDRLIIVDNDLQAMYRLTNYRLVRDRSDAQWLKDHDLYYQKRVEGQPIVSVYRVRDLSKAVQMSRSSRPYTEAEILQLRLELQGQRGAKDQREVDVTLVNDSDIRFSALSATGNQLALTWRLLDDQGKPVTGWFGRLDLPVDVPPHSRVPLTIGFDPGTYPEDRSLQVDVFQTGRFWAHEAGAPLAILPPDRKVSVP